jgi:carboxynorspermidine decarboxylase
VRDLSDISAETPLFLVDAPALRSGLVRMRALADEAGCAVFIRPREIPRFLLSLFSEFAGGTAAQTLEEARLGRAHIGGAALLSTAACRKEDAEIAAELCSHAAFLSIGQAEKHRAVLMERGVLVGLTVTPENLRGVCGMDGARLREAGVSGFRFEFPASGALHAWKTLEAFGKQALGEARWLSFGRGFSLCGGEGRAEFCAGVLREIKKRGFEVYLEAGHEAARGAVHLLCTVLDVLPGLPPTAVLDVSAAAVAPDLPRPRVDGAGYPGEKPYHYRLIGMAGDIFGDYSFNRPLRAGERLLLRDAARLAAWRDRCGGAMVPFCLLEEDAPR